MYSGERRRGRATFPKSPESRVNNRNVVVVTFDEFSLTKRSKSWFSTESYYVFYGKQRIRLPLTKRSAGSEKQTSFTNHEPPDVFALYDGMSQQTNTRSLFKHFNKKKLKKNNNLYNRSLRRQRLHARARPYHVRASRGTFDANRRRYGRTSLHVDR